MAFSEASEISVDEIPVVDLAPMMDGSSGGLDAVAKEMRHIAETVGFFYVKNHGVPEDLINRTYEAAKQFFAQGEDEKNRVKVNDRHHGYIAMGGARMGEGMAPDLKESFVWGLDLPDDDPRVAQNKFLGGNQWPTDIPGYRDALTAYFDAVNKLGEKLMGAFAVGMGLPAESFNKNFNPPITRGSLVYYPEQPPQSEEEVFGVAPHTDYGCMTILRQDHVGGLEVQTKAGEWVTAHPIDGTFVVNVGDLLARWTNDGFASTPHRVVNRRAENRYSLVMAVDPSFETLIDPKVVCRDGEEPRYDEITCGDYILWRFDRAFGYRKSENADT